jgi:preprotein translocase subunit SecY
MLDAFRNLWKVGDIRKRILVTLLMLVVYRLGSHIPAPGVNISVLAAYFDRMQGSVLGLFDMFVGGNLSRATIFALGIMPYISASIILQILGATIPFYQRLSKEGEEGRRNCENTNSNFTIFAVDNSGYKKLDFRYRYGGICCFCCCCCGSCYTGTEKDTCSVC